MTHHEQDPHCVVNRHMWELEVCGSLAVDRHGGYREIESFMGASNTSEGIAEDSGRDSILYRNLSPPVLNTRLPRTYHGGELEIRLNLETCILWYQGPLLLPQIAKPFGNVCDTGCAVLEIANTHPVIVDC